MGQYHYCVNLDKKEFLDPRKLNSGMKLWEQIANHPSPATALFILVACSNGRGGGDLERNPVIGRWAGDRIAVVGDYAESDDLPAEFDAVDIYSQCCNDEYKDISSEVAEIIERELRGNFFDGLFRRQKEELATQ